MLGTRECLFSTRPPTLRVSSSRRYSGSRCGLPILYAGNSSCLYKKVVKQKSRRINKLRIVLLKKFTAAGARSFTKTNVICLAIRYVIGSSVITDRNGRVVAKIATFAGKIVTSARKSIQFSDSCTYTKIA